jgi:Protein of unknown function (DUF3025)
MAGLNAVHAFSVELARIDWSRPWLEPFRAYGMRWQRVVEKEGTDAWLAAMTRDAADVGLRTAAGAPLTFVAQRELPEGTPYEAHIAATGCVPTRGNLHDFFNAASWFVFPRTKIASTARGMAEVAHHQADPPGARGPVRDALTHFDENGAIFATHDAALADALRGFDWPTLFVSRRAAWPAQCAVVLFGHALIEKLVAPYKACTAHAWICEVERDFFAAEPAVQREWLDARLAIWLAAPERLTIGRFSPLPVLGVPGWWGENDEPSFYADESVFRRGRRRVRPDAKMSVHKAGQTAAAFAQRARGEESPDSTGQGDG